MLTLTNTARVHRRSPASADRFGAQDMNAVPKEAAFRRGSSTKWVPLISGGVSALGALAVVLLLVSPPGVESDQAERILSRPGGDHKRASALAIKAIMSSPIDAKAVRALALTAEASNRPEYAHRLMQVAAKVSRRDTPSQVWLMDKAFQKGAYQEAFKQADLILRRNPQLGDTFFPVLSSVARDPKANAELVRTLQARPSWRSAFLEHVADNSDPAITFALLSGLNERGSALTDDEVGRFLERLMVLRQFDSALLTWLLFLPPNRLAAFDGVYDGEFNDLAGAQPFRWSIPPTGGAQVEIATPPDRPKDPAMHVSYDGFSTGILFYQTVVLPIESMQVVSGEYFHETPAAADRLEWAVVCIETGEVVFRSPLPPSEGRWTRFRLSFTVPGNQCGAQRLEMRASPGDRRTEVGAWFDKVAIQPYSDKAA